VFIVVFKFRVLFPDVSVIRFGCCSCHLLETCTIGMGNVASSAAFACVFLFVFVLVTISDAGAFVYFFTCLSRLYHILGL
jgi:hypothetical protein